MSLNIWHATLALLNDVMNDTVFHAVLVFVILMVVEEVEWIVIMMIVVSTVFIEMMWT